MKAYSQDLRKRIVETVESGLNKSATARRFKVSLNTVKRYVKQFEQTNQLEPNLLPGRPATFTPQKLDLLKAQIAAKPDATLQEQADHWFENQGDKLSPATFSRALKRMKISYKKKPQSPRA